LINRQHTNLRFNCFTPKSCTTQTGFHSGVKIYTCQVARDSTCSPRLVM